MNYCYVSFWILFSISVPHYFLLIVHTRPRLSCSYLSARLAHALPLDRPCCTALHSMNDILFHAQLLHQSSPSFDQDWQATWVESDIQTVRLFIEPYVQSIPFYLLCVLMMCQPSTVSAPSRHLRRVLCSNLFSSEKWQIWLKPENSAENDPLWKLISDLTLLPNTLDQNVEVALLNTLVKALKCQED
jgi:hypothetical protein